MLTPGRIKPAMPFVQAKGLLPLPANGRRVLNYGDKTQYGSQSKGLVLETRHAAQIVSPTDGWIVYSGEFRSYGRLLIINAGGGYHILLAGLSQIDVQLGQFVLAGEPVGVSETFLITLLHRVESLKHVFSLCCDILAANGGWIFCN